MKVGPTAGFDYPFDLSGAVSHFDLLAVPGDPAVETSLVAPDGSEHRLSVNETTTFVPGVQFTVHALAVRAGAFYVEGAIASAATTQSGLWRLRFRTSDAAKGAVLNNASIDVQASVQARLTNPDLPLRKGRPGQFVVSLVSAGGQPLPETAFMSGSDLKINVNGAAVQAPAANADVRTTGRVPVVVATRWRF